MLKLKDALIIMESILASGKPKAFSILFCTADKSRGTGGEIIYIDKAILSRLKYQRQPKRDQISRPNAPRHHKNRTRNICALGTSEIRKLNIDLILELNGQQIP